MRTKRNWIIAVTAQVAISFLATQSSASPLSSEGGIIRWDRSTTNTNLNYYIDPSASSLSAVIQASFSEWQAIPSQYLTFTQVGSAASAQIVVRVLSDLGIGGAAGVAYVSGQVGGYITSCDLRISSATATSTNATYVKSVVQHESGHCLGLAHSIVLNAVMSYHPNAASSPTDDDKFALTLLYPRNGADLPLGCATIERSRDGDKSGPGGIIPPLLMMALGFGILRKTAPRAYSPFAG